jgi:hypothetical protein
MTPPKKKPNNNNTNNKNVFLIFSIFNFEKETYCVDILFSLLFDGLECVAGKLAPKNDGLCFKRMAGYVKDDPGALFDQIKPLLASMGQQIDLRFANKVGECNVNKGNLKHTNILSIQVPRFKFILM